MKRVVINGVECALVPIRDPLAEAMSNLSMSLDMITRCELCPAFPLRSKGDCPTDETRNRVCADHWPLTDEYHNIIKLRSPNP
jgi:hypothetical protein